MKRRWPGIPKEPTLDPERSNTADNNIETRHEGSRAHGSGQDYRTNPTKLLVAEDERADHRLRQKLPEMSAEQSLPTSAIQTIPTTTTSVRTLAINSHGFHHEAPGIGRVRPALGSHRSIHQDGTLPPTTKRRKDGGRLSGHIHPGNMEVPWPSHRYRVRQRLPLYFRNLEGVSTAVRNSAPDVDSIRPANRWTDGTAQPDDRGLYPIIHWQGTERLGTIAANGRVRVQQLCHNGKRYVPVLRKLLLSPHGHGPDVNGASQPGQQNIRPLDEQSARRILKRAGRSTRTNTAIYRPNAEGTPSIPSRGLGDVQWAQHQNAPTLEEAGSQKSRSLPDRENRRPTCATTHASPQVEIQNIFHVSLLEPYRTREHRAPPDPSKVLREADDIEQSEEYDVDELMSLVKRGRGNSKQILYFVKWLDYPERKDWMEEPFYNFSVGGLEKLWEFHQRNPDAPRDYRLTEG